MKTYNQLCIDARNAVRACGSENPNMEARNLVAFAAGKTMGELVRDYMLYASGEIEQKVNALVQRRQNGEPLAYILGKTDFFGLELCVNPACLTPRADTEVIVEKALEFLGEKNAEALDICTGSGCIALAIAANSRAKVLGVDISEDALAVAKKNAKKCALSEKVRFERRDALAKDFLAGEKYDLIVSNPPYIPTADIETLSREVHREPMLALDGGADGLTFYRRFLQVLPAHLKEDGAIIFEIGYDQEADILALCENAHLYCEIFRDYGGNVRGAVIKVKEE